MIMIRFLLVLLLLLIPIYGNPIALLTTILHKIQFLTLMLLLNTYLQGPIVLDVL